MSNYDFVVSFLLEEPPIQEIEDPIVELVEMYREGIISYKQAAAEIQSKHSSCLDKYIHRASLITENCLA